MGWVVGRVMLFKNMNIEVIVVSKERSSEMPLTNSSYGEETLRISRQTQYKVQLCANLAAMGGRRASFSVSFRTTLELTKGSRLTISAPLLVSEVVAFIQFPPLLLLRSHQHDLLTVAAGLTADLQCFAMCSLTVID